MKKILVVVDVQNDFIDGSLRNEDAIKAIPNIVNKINTFDGDYIFVTRDTHSVDYLSTPEGKKLPVEHCIYNTTGWLINGEVISALHKKELSESPVIISYINKPTFGSFELVKKIQNAIDTMYDDIIEIEFIGFCTDICVISNALILRSLDEYMPITIDASCCAGSTPVRRGTPRAGWRRIRRPSRAP